MLQYYLFLTDVKRRSLYDEDSLDGDHPNDNQGIIFFRFNQQQKKYKKKHIT